MYVQGVGKISLGIRWPDSHKWYIYVSLCDIMDRKRMKKPSYCKSKFGLAMNNHNLKNTFLSAKFLLSIEKFLILMVKIFEQKIFVPSAFSVFNLIENLYGQYSKYLTISNYLIWYLKIGPELIKLE